MDTKDNSACAQSTATDFLAVTERMEALTTELSALMGEYASGRWMAIIGADNAIRFVPNARMQHGTTDDFLAQAPISVVIEYHLSQLTLAMRKQNPGYWIGRIEADGLSAHVTHHVEPAENAAWISLGVAS